MIKTDISLADRMKLQTIRRTHKGAVLQMTMVLFLIGIFRLFAQAGPLGESLFAYIFVLLLIRWVYVRRIYRDEAALLRSFHYQMLIAMLTAFAYGAITADGILFFDEWVMQPAILFFTTLGVIAIVVQSLALAPFYQKLYLFLISTPVLGAFAFRASDRLYLTWGILFLIYTAYLWINSGQITRDALHAYSMETTAREQKDVLQKVINLVPGFVAMADRMGEWTHFSPSFLAVRDSVHFHEILNAFQTEHPLDFSVWTREFNWDEDGVQHAYIVSIQRYEADNSMIVVGVPAENLVAMRRQLDDQRSRAEFSSRLATLGEVAGGIAHEINNPLAVILGNCEHIERMVRDDVIPREKVLHRVAVLEKTAHRIEKIVKGLRSFARQGDNDPIVETMLQQVIDDTMELCSERFRINDVNLEVAMVPHVHLMVRGVQISQVLINLLNNAYDAVQKTMRKSVRIHFRQLDNSVAILVSDTGHGVPVANRQKIFEPFFTTKDPGQGTGLGLSISRSIALEHGGELHLLEGASDTTFELRLPSIPRTRG